ncbi:hypothetical protein ACFWTE_11610 [Nocardiopsis sp. NPDC058631]|uniref:hypothetical protein n=1 Tax=Nocardiopsis sp. NPDC058631 TaxID=3346566 RepID=UPI0036616ADA
MSRTCGWCGDPVPYSGKGRPPQYCGKAHRNRAWEVRSAQARQERDRAAGTARPEGEPVREVVRETVTRSARIEVPAPGRVRTVQVEVPVEVERPVRLESAAEVCAVLHAVETAVRQGRFPEDGLDHVLRRAVALTEAIQDYRGWED